MNGAPTLPEVVIMSGRGTAAMVAVVGFLFVLTGLAVMTALIPGEEPVAGMVLGGVCVVFFGFITAVSVRRLYKPEPILCINQKGLVVSPNPLETHSLIWREIEDVEQFSYRGARFVGVKVRDPKAHARRLPLVSRFLFSANRRLGHSGIAIPAVAIDGGLDEIEAIILEHLTRASASV